MLTIAGLLIYFKNEYLFQRFIFLMGLLFVPFIFRKKSEEKSTRYGVLSLLAGFVLFFENGNMAFYFCAVFGLLFLWEIKNGRLNNLPLYLFVIISPVFQYIAEVWSFPIRLQLSQWAGKVLSAMGKKVEVAGNVIMLDGQEFAVDPACMGLNMLSVSLLLCLVLLARQERMHKFSFPFWEINIWMFLAFLLSIFSNFNRLLSLVLFQVLPENPMHDVWGLVALFAFVLAPVYYLLNRRFDTFDKTENADLFLKKNIFYDWAKRFYFPQIISASIIFILFFNGNKKNGVQPANTGSVAQISLPGFAKSTTPDGMLKLEDGSVLVYVKPPAGFLRASHDPRICWRGSGFEFKKVEKRKINGIEIYTAKMANGDEILNTAWWYDNGSNKTVEEWVWRWGGLFGGDTDYCLVNVTAATIKELEMAIGEINGSLFLK